MNDFMTPEQFNALPKTKTARTSLLIGIFSAVSLLLALGGFFGGIQYQKTRQPKVDTAFATGGPSTLGVQSGGFGGPMRVRPTFGQVTAISSTSITVDGRDGSTKTLTIGSNTVVDNNGQTAAVSDIKVGDTVAVMVDTSDTTTAARILLNPSFSTQTSGGESGARFFAN